MKNMLIVAVVACLLGISTARASEDDDFTIICHTRAQIEDIVSHDVKGDMADAMRAYKKYAAPPKSECRFETKPLSEALPILPDNTEVLESYRGVEMFPGEVYDVQIVRVQHPGLNIAVFAAAATWKAEKPKEQGI